MIELHHKRVPASFAVSTRLVLGGHDHGPDLRLIAIPLFPPHLLVGVIMRPVVGPFLLGREHGYLLHRRAGDGNRTRVSCLEGRGSTIELHPHKWAGRDSNPRST